MYKLAAAVLLALAVGSCASLPDNCAAGQTVAWDEAAESWTCADPVTGTQRHTHQVTEILTGCESGQVVVWDGQASGWVCRDAGDHSHEDAEGQVFTPTYYTVDVSVENEEDLSTVRIEGHQFCALSESRTASGGRCEVLRTTEGFSLQAWARPNSRSECGAVCF